jgi:hypothetical protein
LVQQYRGGSIVSGFRAEPINHLGIRAVTSLLAGLVSRQTVCADDWVVRPYRTAGKWGEPIKVPSIMDLFFNPDRKIAVICSMTILRTSQINADHPSAAGTIGSRACWLLDTITFGEMP